MANCLLKLENAQIGYDRNHVVLGPLSLEISANEFIAIVGPNGSGKTALVRTLLGLEPLISGTLTPAPGTLRLGYVPQNNALSLNSPLTGEEFLDLAGPQSGLEARQFSQTLGLSELDLAKPIERLSGGQRQRLIVAFALAGKPQVIVLDEATDGLDFRSQREFFARLQEICKSLGTAILLVSHDITAVGAYASRVICLTNAIAYDGDPKSPEFHSCLHNIYGKESFIHHHDHRQE